MLHVWLVPALAILFAGLAVFYWVMKLRGGTGVRTEGQTLVDQPDEEEPAEKG